jgi:hypothetical protein
MFATFFSQGAYCAGGFASNGTKTAQEIEDRKSQSPAKSFEVWAEIAKIHAWLARFFATHIALPTLTVR